MEEESVVPLPRPGGTVESDPLLGVLREGARRMLRPAIEAEVAALLAAHAELVDAHGRRRLVQHGRAPRRAIQAGIGPVEVRRPRIRDWGDGASPPIRSTSSILPAYLRRTRNVEELLPWLYLKGLSTGQEGVTLKNGHESTARGTEQERGQAASARFGLVVARRGRSPSGPTPSSAPQR